MPTTPIYIPFEGFGTYVVYWTDEEPLGDEDDSCGYWGIAIANPDIRNYHVEWNTSEDPDYSYEDLLCMRKSFREGSLRPQWICSLSLHDHGGISIYPTGARNYDRWDSTACAALWYPSSYIRNRVLKDLVPLFRFLKINYINDYRGGWELIRKDTKQRIVPYKFWGDLHTFSYIFDNVSNLRKLIPELDDCCSSYVSEEDLNPEDWKIVEQCVMYLCKTDCKSHSAESGYVGVSMDFIDMNGRVHPCDLPASIYLYDHVYKEWSNQTLKNFILDYGSSEIRSQLERHRKFTCPKCGEHRLYAKYRLPSYMVCNNTVALNQLADPKSSSPESYIGAGYPRLGPSVPDPSELETASCSHCGYEVTDEIRPLLGTHAWPEDSKIFQKYSEPEDWKALLDTLHPPETW